MTFRLRILWTDGWLEKVYVQTHRSLYLQLIDRLSHTGEDFSRVHFLHNGARIQGDKSTIEYGIKDGHTIDLKRVTSTDCNMNDHIEDCAIASWHRHI